MESGNIKDLLTSFSPSGDFHAIATPDGRVKVWDTLRGQLRTEFADLASADGRRGHLSIDYKCMQWVKLGRKKKSKPGDLVLVLGTGGGDIVALDVSAGQMKWKLSDCHPGGVTAVSFSEHGQCTYTAGKDGMVCQIDPSTGTLLGKFKASTKAISSLSISSDGKTLATAAAQLKVVSCLSNKKIQKFSGHTVGVRCMTFSEDGSYLLSSAVGERFIAIWEINGKKNQSACCVLSMEHPAVCLNCKGTISEDGKDAGLYVLAVSEIGLCHFWYGTSIKELHNSKPTKIYISVATSIHHKDSLSQTAIYSAKLKSTGSSSSGTVLVAYGSTVKPSFEKLSVQHGVEINLKRSQDGALLPMLSSNDSKKDRAMRVEVTTLDRANAEDAIIPLPKLHEHQEKKRKHKPKYAEDEVTDSLDEPKAYHVDRKVQELFEEEGLDTKMEDKLKALGILSNSELASSGSFTQNLTSANPNLDDATLKSVLLLVDTNKPAKKITETMLSMFQSDSFKLLGALIFLWKARSISEQKLLPWICHILVNHNYQIISQDQSKHVLDGLHKMARFKCQAVGPLLRLSGCLQLIRAQIAKGEKDSNGVLHGEHPSINTSDDEDDDIDEVVYGEGDEDACESNSDDE